MRDAKTLVRIGAITDTIDLGGSALLKSVIQ